MTRRAAGNGAAALEGVMQQEEGTEAGITWGNQGLSSAACMRTLHSTCQPLVDVISETYKRQVFSFVSQSRSLFQMWIELCLERGREQHFAIAARQADEAPIDAKAFSAIGQVVAPTTPHLHAHYDTTRSTHVCRFDSRAWRRWRGGSKHDELTRMLDDEGVTPAFEL